jgi:hypothetical protein
MSNGKIGDHPLSDVLIHGRIVYSKRATELIREVVELADDRTKRELSDRLLFEFNEYSTPDIPRLEAELEALLNRLRKEAKARGFEAT